MGALPVMAAAAQPRKRGSRGEGDRGRTTSAPIHRVKGDGSATRDALRNWSPTHDALGMLKGAPASLIVSLLGVGPLSPSDDSTA
jgi:hypothetical protein